MKGELSIDEGISAKRLNKKKQVFHGDLIGSCYAEGLDCDLSEVAKLVHHVLTSSDNAFQDSLATKDCSQGYKCLAEKVDPISSSSSIQKVLKKVSYFAGFKLNPRPWFAINHAGLRGEKSPDVNEIKSCTIKKFEEVSRDDSTHLKDSTGYKVRVTSRSISVIRRELPESALGWPLLRRTTRLAQENSEVRNSNEKKISSDLKADDSLVKKCKIEGTVVQLSHTTEDKPRDGSSNREDEKFGLRQEVSSNSGSVLTKESTRSVPGWPFLRIKTSASLEFLQESQAEEFSVVRWALNLPNRSKETTTKFQIDFVSQEVESYVENKIFGYDDKHNDACLAAPTKLPKKVDCYGCKQFSYKELKKATCHFSSENFVGEGGCSNVYKGYLPGGKQVAVKILKQYKEAWNDFSLEVDIINDARISVVIQVSMIMQPQLSDFGLAIWGPVDLAYATHSDVVGTFGYIAPEYFMNGMVSDKIDVYSFGIVLLELLTGKKPIISKGLKGQESLVKWATPLLESRNLKALLDPKMDRDFDIVQIQRMVLAATLCVRQTARLRPQVSQILELLRGEKGEREWVNGYANDLKKSSNEEFDDLFLEFGCKPCMEASFLELDYDDASPSSVDTASLSSVDVTSPSRAGRKSRFMLGDYLKEEQD
ncbi:unnamed protein product [Dovyalis caffra]|uniref:Protein kinase domain-containing protein n=1 Tax=Dovyalis caffra TaxID=77055 RepID=A0AAV1S5F2_9ROSI|nr:unnamed protein product [Dovyalis caffra]